MSISLDATRRIPGFPTSRDATTGWRVPITWTEETIEIINVGKGITVMQTVGGEYAHVNEVGQTADPIEEGDQLIYQGTYYSVESVVERYFPGDNFHHRDVGLNRVSMYEATPNSATWKTAPNDPSERTKTLIDTYTRDAQILKDDGSTQAAWACIFENPPYHLYHEFRAASSPVDGLYVVGHATTTTLVDALSKKVYGYDEVVPVHIVTVDSTGYTDLSGLPTVVTVTGRALQWRMQAELRYVVEENPTGSIWATLSAPRADHTRSLGSMKLYDVEYAVSYRRGTT